MNVKRLAVVSVGCAAIGLLLIFEVFRPFRDLAKDGPLAMTLWGMGAIAAIASFFLRPRAIVLSIVALLANLIPICVVTVPLRLLGHSKLIGP